VYTYYTRAPSRKTPPGGGNGGMGEYKFLFTRSFPLHRGRSPGVKNALCNVFNNYSPDCRKYFAIQNRKVSKRLGGMEKFS
jgi:hypothetical protein